MPPEKKVKLNEYPETNNLDRWFNGKSQKFKKKERMREYDLV